MDSISNTCTLSPIEIEIYSIHLTVDTDSWNVIYTHHYFEIIVQIRPTVRHYYLLH